MDDDESKVFDFLHFHYQLNFGLNYALELMCEMMMNESQMHSEMIIIDGPLLHTRWIYKKLVIKE